MRKADNLPPSCAVVTKSGNLNFLEPSGPLQACNERFTFFYTQMIHKHINSLNIKIYVWQTAHFIQNMYICYQTSFCVLSKTVSVIIIINLNRSSNFSSVSRYTASKQYVAAMNIDRKAAEGQKWRTQKQQEHNCDCLLSRMCATHPRYPIYVTSYRPTVLPHPPATDA